MIKILTKGLIQLIKYKGFLLPLALLATWQLLSSSGVWSAYLLPSPFEVYQATIELSSSGILFTHLWSSFLRVIGGFLLACLLALPLAVFIGRSPNLGEWFYPILTFFRHTPPLAMIPLFILWLGIGELTKLAIIIMASFFPIFLNAENGIRRADPKLIEVGKSLHLSSSSIFLKIIFPASLPSILLGMRIGLGYSWRALIGAEMIAASSGLGYLILDAEQMSRTDIVIVGILAIGIFGTLVDLLFQKASKKFLPWEKEATQNG